jgi:hypothetical protein
LTNGTFGTDPLLPLEGPSPPLGPLGLLRFVGGRRFFFSGIFSGFGATGPAG